MADVKPITQETINAICKSIQEELKDPSILNTFGAQVTTGFPSLATDIPSIDRMLCGGFPKGRITEIFGPEGSGKTTLMLHLIAACQRRNQLVYYVDAENALDPSYARRIGVIPERLVHSQPDYGEQALEVVRVICETVVKYREVNGQQIDSLIVVDSVPALVPKQDYDKVEDKGIETGGFATARARMLSQFLPKIFKPAAEAQACLVFVNQERASMSPYGPQTTQPGGSTLKYACSLRLRIKRTGNYDVGGETRGNKTNLVPIKSKLFSIFQKSADFIITENGIDVVADVVQGALESGVVSKQGAWVKFGDLTWQGLAKFDEAMHTDKDLYAKVTAAVAAKKQ